MLRKPVYGINPAEIELHPLEPGDAGWLVYRHGAIIAPEFGWNMEFEALCAQIMADFITKFKPESEQSWIAKYHGKILGSLFLVRDSDDVARLRLLYIEPEARGLGLASRLLDASVAFAKEKGYKKLVLFTTGNNTAARRIYTRMSMQLTKKEPLHFAGKQEMGETWELELALF